MNCKVLIIALACFFCTSVPGNQKKSDAAPDFKTEASDGKTYTLKALTEKKPVYFYFINRTCPVNGEAFKHFQSIQASYKGKVNFIGVIDGDKTDYDDWQKEFKSDFPVILDPKLKIIRSYAVQASPTIIKVESNGIISIKQLGYSRDSLKELNSMIAKETGMKKAALAFIDAPQRFTFG